MNYKELYELLKYVLSKDQFEFDDKTTSISIKNSFRFNNLEENIISLIGTKIRPTQVDDDFSWKIRPELIMIDNQTIKFNKYGKLYSETNQKRILTEEIIDDIEEETDSIGDVN